MTLTKKRMLIILILLKRRRVEAAMKKFIHLAISSLFLLTSGLTIAQQAGVSYYAKFDISLQNNGVDKTLPGQSQHQTNLQSNGSRIGLSFDNLVVGPLTLIGQLESAVDLNTRKSPENYFSERNSYLGIETRWGRLLTGRHDTPLKLAQGHIDLFSDSDVQMYALHRGENRVSDVFMYRTRQFNAFKFDLALVKNNASAINKQGLSAALTYQRDGFYTAIALDKDILDDDILRWVGSYQYQNLTLSGMWQRTESLKTNDISTVQEINLKNTNKRNRGYTLSARYDLSLFAVNLQYTESDEIVQSGRLLSLGVDWQLSNSTKVYVFYSDKQASQQNQQGRLVSLGIKYHFFSD
jgi:predicted porin